MPLTLTERYWAARITIVFVTFIFTLLGTIVLTWMVRRHRDSARWCFTYAKFLGVLFAVYCFVDLCSFILWIAFSRLLNASKDRDYDDQDAIGAVLLGRVELAAAARMCDYIVIIFLFVSLVTMGNGVIHSRTGSPGKYSKIIKRSADGISVLLGALSAAQWGVRIRVYLEFYLEDNTIRHGGGDRMMDLLNISRQLDFVTLLITLLCSLATMGRAVMIYLPTRADKHIYWPSHCLLLCSSLWLLRSLYDTVYQARYVDLIDVRRSREEEYYIPVISVIFYILPVLFILYAILALGMRKTGGLWSTQQPWMLYNPTSSEDVPLSQDVPLEPQTRNLPPAYSPPPSSASPSMHHQQPIEAWRGSPANSASPVSQPQEVMRPPLPPLSTTAGTLPVQQALGHQPTDVSVHALGGQSSAAPSNRATSSAASGSPGSSQQPFVVEDRGPAPLSLSESPRSHGQTMVGPSPTQQEVTPPAVRNVVPEASTVVSPVSPLVPDDHVSGGPPEKSTQQPPVPSTSRAGAVGDDYSPGRYQQAPMDNGYNTGIVSPVSPTDLVPADGFYRPQSPPPHDEAMGFNHQADGRAPTEPLAYPEKG